MRGVTSLGAILLVLATALGGCYMVPGPPPAPNGAIPPLPPHAQTMRCPWSYGNGWGGWGWYAIC
jgi:hypothetical protein